MSSILLILFLWPGSTYLRAADYREAYRYYMLQAAIDPSDDNNYYSGICALINGDIDTSLAMFNGVHSRYRSRAYYQGVIHYQKQLVDDAQDFFTKVIHTSSPFWQAYYYLGLIELRQNRVEKATAYLREVPDTANLARILPYIEDYNKLVHARELFSLGNYDEAIRLYENVGFYFGYREIGLAHAYVELKEYAKCLFLLDDVIAHAQSPGLVTHGLYLAAQVSLVQHEVVRARNYLSEYLAIKNNDQVRYMLGKTYSDEIKHDSALIFFQELPDTIDEYLFYKARSEYFLGLWGRAEEKLLRHREQFPNSPYGDRATFILASINYKRKEYHYAIDFFSELVSVYPNSIYAVTAQRNIGSAYYELEDYTKALEAFQKVKELTPSKTTEEETELLIYETKYKLGSYYTLVDALRAFVENNPASRLVPKTQLRIAKILFEQKDYYVSLSELDKIIDGNPKQTVIYEAYLEKARIYGVLGSIDKQKHILKELLADEEAKSHHSFVANELATIFMTTSKLDSALYFYNVLLDDPKYREKALFEIASIYDQLGQYSESTTMIDRLILEYPQSVFLFDAYLLKTKVYKNNGDYDQAESLLEELLTKLGKRPEIYMELGHLYFEIEEYVLAHDSYLLAGELYKQNRDSAAQALLYAGEASVAIGDMNRAREHYLQAHLIAESASLKDQANALLSAISEQ